MGGKSSKSAQNASSDGAVNEVKERKVIPPVAEKGQNEFLRFSALSNAGFEMDGLQKTNQDSFISIANLGEPTVSVFGVYDGHGACGHLVSDFVRKELPRMLDREMLKTEAVQKEPDLKRVGRHAMATYERVNAALEADKSIDSSLSGTTAVTAIVLGGAGARWVVVANSGDSRAFLARHEGGTLKTKALSIDQKPELEAERQRILKCGGRVEPLLDEHGNALGPHRVWLSNMMLPGLAMTRSIGDDIAATAGVCALPEIETHKLAPEDKFMVLASDGVWEFLSSNEVAEIVERCHGDADKAAKEVCAAAHREWKAEEMEVVDDITAVVVYFTKI